MAATPGTTNFLQINPGESNCDSDSQYASEPLITSGLQSGQLLPSKAFNKFMYQASTFYTAIANAFAAKGYNVLDISLAQLTSIFSSIVTQADQISKLLLLTFSPTLTFDASLATGWEVTLFGNVTSSSIVNTTPGQIYRFVIRQGNNGGFSFSPPPSIGNQMSQPDTDGGSISKYALLCLNDGTLTAIDVQIN